MAEALRTRDDRSSNWALMGKARVLAQLVGDDVEFIEHDGTGDGPFIPRLGRSVEAIDAASVLMRTRPRRARATAQDQDRYPPDWVPRPSTSLSDGTAPLFQECGNHVTRVR